MNKYRFPKKFLKFYEQVYYYKVRDHGLAKQIEKILEAGIHSGDDMGISLKRLAPKSKMDRTVTIK